MKRVLLSLVTCLGFFFPSQAQSLTTGEELLDNAFSLAVWTIDNNTHDGIIEAGKDMNGALGYIFSVSASFYGCFFVSCGFSHFYFPPNLFLLIRYGL